MQFATLIEPTAPVTLSPSPVDGATPVGLPGVLLDERLTMHNVFGAPCPQMGGGGGGGGEFELQSISSVGRVPE